MPVSLPNVSPARVRSSLIRLPLATKVIVVLIVVFYFTSWSLGFQHWAQLAPDKVFSGGAHRLSTYPFLHLNLFHALLNVFAVVPLLDKFETENGTIVTAILFSGPFTTFPGLLYTLICTLLHINTPVQGSSIWFFLLISSTLYRASKTTPSISIPGTATGLPTAVIPLVLILVTTFIIPHASLLGHLCGAAIGYGWGSGILRFLSPPEKILRWVEDKLGLRTRLPSSYVSVEKGAYGGRYGLGSVLPTNNGSAGVAGSSMGMNGGVIGTGDTGIKLGE